MSEEKRTEVIERPVAAPITKKPFPLGGIIAIAAVVAILTGIIGFASGVQFQKLASNNRSSNQTARLNQQREFGPRSMMRNGTFGEVTAISDTSITVSTRQRFNSSNNSSTATTKTYTINTSTKITIDGTTGKASDIKTGDEVMITPSASDSSVASGIRVGMGTPAQQSSENSDSDSSTRTN